MSMQRVVAYLRNSLWFIPGLWVLGAGVAGFGMIAVDSLTPSFASQVPLIFGGGADGARSVLSSIASSAITVAGVTFSITVVALQLASSQYSPSVLRNFMRDRISQMVLGSFIGAFFYSILVLRSIRAETTTSTEFVPSLAVSIGIAFAIVALVMLVYFIHHISTRIQVSTIVATIVDETNERIRQEWREESDGVEREADVPPGPSQAIRACASGYLQLIDRDGLVDIGHELDLVVRVDRRAGEWVQEGARLFSVWPASADPDALAERMARHVTLGAERSLEQDAGFGIRQLVDVAVKALSPGINDPTTAVDCINRLTQLLVATGTRREPQRLFPDGDGRLRLIVAGRSYLELVALAFDEIRHYGTGTPAVAHAAAAAIGTIVTVVPPARHPPLWRQARLLADGAGEIRSATDREEVLARLREILAAEPATTIA